MNHFPFVHLHCHTHYSLLDGAGSIDKLVTRAKERGMNALAITDHGNLHGALEFYRKAKAADLNPIIGYEAYIAPGSRFQKDAGRMKEASYHLTLLAKNRTGFKNLIKLASAAYLEGFYFKPRIDKELLAAHSEGLICLSGCVSGELSRTLLKGGMTSDEELARFAGDRALVPRRVWRPLLYRDPEQWRGDPAVGDGRIGAHRRSSGLAAGGHQRCSLRRSRRRRSPGRDVVHQHRAFPHRHQSDEDGRQRVLPAQSGGNVRGISSSRRCRRPQPGNRRFGRHRLGTRPAPLSHLFAVARRQDGRSVLARDLHSRPEGTL